MCGGGGGGEGGHPFSKFDVKSIRLSKINFLKQNRNRKLSREKKMCQISTHRLFRLVVLSIATQNTQPTCSSCCCCCCYCCCCCLELKLLTAQPCWFPLYQWRAEKGWLVTYSALWPNSPAFFMTSLTQSA